MKVRFNTRDMNLSRYMVSTTIIIITLLRGPHKDVAGASFLGGVAGKGRQKNLLHMADGLRIFVLRKGSGYFIAVNGKNGAVSRVLHKMPPPQVVDVSIHLPIVLRGNGKGRHPCRVSSFCLSPLWDKMSQSKGRSAALISLARHKTAILGATLLLRCGGPEGQAANLSTRGSWPWGGLSPLVALMLFARSPERGSLGAPAARLPALCSEPPLFSC